MPIRKEPKGLAGLYARAGKFIGQAEAARREEERVERISTQLRSFAHQKEMAEFSAQLQLAREKRNYTRQFETEERAYQWQLEKMQMASQMDFTREEQRRQKKLDERQSKLDALERAFKEGTIDEDDYQTAYLQTITDVPFYAQAQIAERARERPEFGRTDVTAAVKFLEEFEEKEKKAGRWYTPFAPEPTEIEKKAAEYYRSIIEQIGEPTAREVMPEAVIAKTYSIGEIIEARGKRYKVVGYDTDGTPLLDPV